MLVRRIPKLDKSRFSGHPDPIPSPLPDMKPATPLPPGHGRFFLIFGGIYFVLTLLLGISPRHPADWWMEHLIILFGFSILFATSRTFVFSKAGYFLAFFFLCFHGVGAHYTYSEVPYREWWAALTGGTVDGGSRNHFDRAVHFLYGFLLTRPFREAVYFVLAPRSTFWSHLAVITFIMASSLFYELFEWAAAEIWGGEAGMAFLGTQGDIWDAHKDMFLATVGALLGSLGMILHVRFTGKDPARDWGEERAKAAAASQG